MILDWFFMDILQEEIFTALREKLRQISPWQDTTEYRII